MKRSVGGGHHRLLSEGSKRDCCRQRQSGLNTIAVDDTWCGRSHPPLVGGSQLSRQMPPRHRAETLDKRRQQGRISLIFPHYYCYSLDYLIPCFTTVLAQNASIHFFRFTSSFGLQRIIGRYSMLRAFRFKTCVVG